MTNEQLVANIKAGINISDNIIQLYNQLKPFISKMAKKYSGYAEYEDLMQEAYFGLMDAVERYKEGMGSVFNYATYWIRNSMVNYIQNNASLVRIPPNTYDDIKKYKEFVADFEAYNNRKPSDREAAYYLMKNEKDICFLKKSLAINNMQSMEAIIYDDDETELQEVVAGEEDVEGEVLDRLDKAQMKQELWECVDNLKGKQPEILHMVYEHGMTRKDIGEKIGMTEKNVHQQYANACRELRKGKNRETLLPYYNEYVACHAYKDGNEWDSITERLAIFEYIHNMK